MQIWNMVTHSQAGDNEWDQMLLSDSISNHQHANQQTKGRENMEEIVQEQTKSCANHL